MNPQTDKSIVTQSVALLSILTLLATVWFMVSALIGVVGRIAPDDHSRKQIAVFDRIKPVARVSFEQAKPVSTAALSGSEVYNKVCAACHASGALGAPKTGAKDQWEPRFAQGLATLVTHAVNGIRAMPPKGGDPSLTEVNLKDAIVYMLGETSIKVEDSAAPAPTGTTPATPSAPAESTPASTGANVGGAVPASSDVPVIPSPPIEAPATAPPAFLQTTPTDAPTESK